MLLLNPAFRPISPARLRTGPTAQRTLLQNGPAQQHHQPAAQFASAHCVAVLSRPSSWRNPAKPAHSRHGPAARRTPRAQAATWVWAGKVASGLPDPADLLAMSAAGRWI
jgi:hypothetical protein